jgi:PAS domain S-box-containing protein
LEQKKEKQHLEKEIAALKRDVDELERVKAEAELFRQGLREAAERWRALVELAPDGVVTLDMDGFVNSVNSTFLDLTGFDRNEIIEKHALQMGTAGIDEIFKYEKVLNALVKGEIDFPSELVFRRKDGRHAWVELRVAEVKVDGVTKEIIINAREITKEKKAAARIAESEAKYKQLFSSISAAVIMFELETGYIVEVNDTAVALYGYDLEEWTVLKITDLFVESDTVYETISDPTAESTFFKHIKKDGTVFPVESSASFFSQDDERFVVFVSRDVTLRRELEENLQQAQKMEVIGQLAGGIAHDMNNILGIIMGAATTLSMEKNKGDIHTEDVENILEASRRGAKLTQNFLGFARKGKYVKETILLNDSVKRINALMGHTISKKVTFKTVLDQSLWCIEGDAGQIDNVLMNICINASDAMQGKGELTITTRNVVLGSSANNGADDFEPGKYVQVKISDTGEGMDRGIMTRVFEPFFTTKPEGRGTGLGLSMVYGVVKNHGGDVTVDSDIGEGTTVTLLFPATENGMYQGPAETISKIPRPRLGQGMILLVDDEQMMLNSTRRMLEKFGYRVLSAISGRKAIDIYRRRADDIALVILDFMMPEMDGSETFEELLKIDPEVKVMLSSGYSIDEKIETLLQRGLQGFIQKPFDLNVLLREIAKLST